MRSRLFQGAAPADSLAAYLAFAGVEPGELIELAAVGCRLRGSPDRAPTMSVIVPAADAREMLARAITARVGSASRGST